MECPFCFTTIDDRATVCHGCRAYLWAEPVSERVVGFFTYTAASAIGSLILALVCSELAYDYLHHSPSYWVCCLSFFLPVELLVLRSALRVPTRKWFRR
jgi:hypothetical protein